MVKKTSSRKQKPKDNTGTGKSIRSRSLNSTLDPHAGTAFTRDKPTDQRGALSGDAEGLAVDRDEDFESVAELVNEGQDLEAEQLDSIERALRPDQSELKPRKSRQVGPQSFKDRNR